MRLYFAIARTAYRNETVYRVSVVANTASVLMTCFALYFLWTEIYKGVGSYANVSVSYMVTYAILGVLIGSYQGENVGTYLNQLVRTGEVTNYLMKPISFHALLLCRSIGQTAAKMVTSTLLAVLVCVLFIGIEGPASVYHCIAFLISIYFSYMINFLVLYFIGLLSFFVIEVWGFEFARFAIMSLLAGSLIPWWFFPDQIQLLIKYSVFNCIVGVPSSIYIGKIPVDEVGLALGTQFIWILLLFMIVMLVYRKAVQKITVFGG